MREFIRAHPLHPRIVRHLQDTGFYRIIEIGRLQFDWVLIMTMIEWRRPETHTFYLPIGEATIMLEDVEVLFGLPVDGLPVAYWHALRDYMGLYYLHMLQRLTRFQPAEETALSGASRLQLTPVRQHLEAMDAEITDDSPPERLDDLPGYSWGADVLGYMYRQMCRASMGTQRDVAGFLPLLQFQPPLPPIAPDAPPPPFLPLAWRWIDRRGYGREFEA
nr:serine/threonine-protein phosphatase 7 long form homolog [Nicotiana tomentosiformis]